MWLQLYKDGNGWLLFVLTFAIPLLSRKLRRDQGALIAAWLTVFAHNAAAVTHVYLFELPSGSADANRFQSVASSLDFDSHPELTIYVKFLGRVYDHLGASLFLGCELSVAAYALTLIPFVELIDWLCLTRWRRQLILLYGLLPAPILYCSVTMRESFQALSLIYFVWFVTLIRKNPKAFAPYLGLFASAALIATLHNGLSIYAAVLVGLSLFWSLSGRNRGAALIVLAMCAVLLLPGGPILSMLGKNSNVVKSLMNGELFAYSKHYRETNFAMRADYNVRMVDDSLVGVVISTPLLITFYMFAPFPWQVTGLVDLYALLESFLRMALVLGFFSSLRTAEKSTKVNLIFIFIVFISLESLWAAGTTNWGQAIRHRVVAWPLLVLLGGRSVLEVMFRTEKVANPGVAMNLLGAQPGTAGQIQGG